MGDDSATLYERLGGEGGIAALIDRLYDRLLRDEELAPFFADVSVERIRRMRKEFFAAALGGPAKYAGGSLFAIHSGLRIRQRDFSRYVHLLLDMLRAMGGAAGDLDATVDRVALYSNDIVGEGSVSD